MNRADKLQHIFDLVKKADQKKLSELTQEEYQAVLFCCAAMPASLDGGKAKSNIKNGKATTFQPTYVWLRSNMQKVISPDIVGFSPRKVPNIFIDEEPRTPEFTKDWKDALDSFPSDKVPYKPDDETYAHMPFLPHPGFSVSDPEAKVDLKDFNPSEEDIAYPLMRTAIRIKRGKELDKQDLAVIALTKHMSHYLQVKKIATNLCIPQCYEVINESELEGELPKGSVTHKDISHIDLSIEAIYLGLLKTGRFYRFPADL